MDPKAREQLYARMEATRRASEAAEARRASEAAEARRASELAEEAEAATTTRVLASAEEGGTPAHADRCSPNEGGNSMAGEIDDTPTVIVDRPSMTTTTTSTDYSTINNESSISSLEVKQDIGKSEKMTKGHYLQNQQLESEGPGAFAVQGVIDPDITRNHAPAQQRQATPLTTTAGEVNDNDNVNDNGLGVPVAKPAKDVEELEHAEPVEDPEDQASSRRGSSIYSIINHHKANTSVEWQDQDRCKFVLGLLWLLGIVIMSCMMGILLTTNNDDAQDDDITTPSFAPSATPSGGILDPLLEILPHYSHHSIQNDPFSPQSEAFTWLSNHRNITHLPLWRQVQLFALGTFYYSMDGPNWPTAHQRSWMMDTVDECNWFSSNQGVFDENGVFQEGSDLGENYDGFTYLEWTYKFCNEKLEIKDLTLDNLGLSSADADHQQETATAKVPPELALLTSLQYFFVQTSNVGGTLEDFLPPQFYNMTSIKGIDLFGNSFGGSIPSMFGQMTCLEILDLSINNLIGSLPTELGLLTNLQGLALYHNLLTGSIPSDVGQMTILTQFQMFVNHLEGTIPPEIHRMTNLTDLWLYSNAFTGTLPTLLGGLTKLTTLDVDTNDLTGGLPTQLGLLTSLTALWLSGNSFEGSIPTQFGTLSSVNTLSLFGNELSGSLPSELGLMNSLMRFDVNNLPGLSQTIPHELTGIANLTVLNLNDTSLMGIIPEELCYLQDPNCTTYFAASGWNTYIQCAIHFGCSESLCGCDCDCGNVTV